MSERNIKNLEQALKVIRPFHDTPFGRLHPYWARKPLNIVREIISKLAKKGGQVADPFMGGGTTVFASLLEGRSVAGGDINPLAGFIVSNTIGLLDLSVRDIGEIKEFLEFYGNEISFYFLDSSGKFIIERERFLVDGVYENGKFKLVPIEYKVKRVSKVGAYEGTHVFEPSKLEFLCNLGKESNDPIRFNEIALPPNSRIAIPKGAKLGHYFSERNRFAINRFLILLHAARLSKRAKKTLEFILSMSIPLLRLSDYKASSQWPYWRPKNRLTSRNPIFVFNKKLADVITAAAWLKRNIPALNKHQFVDVSQCAFQNFKRRQEGRQFDLVLTDPPYCDQVPYLEYSAFWINILRMGNNQSILDLEMVKTDCVSRASHSKSYPAKLGQAISTCSAILRRGGFLVWFYQDMSLKNWSTIFQAAIESELKLSSIIVIPKQRRSIKTVTSPGRTLDGDLLIIFRKNKIKGALSIVNEPIERERLLSSLAKVYNKKNTFFKKYVAIITWAMQNGAIMQLADHFSNTQELVLAMDKRE